MFCPQLGLLYEERLTELGGAFSLRFPVTVK